MPHSGSFRGEGEHPILSYTQTGKLSPFSLSLTHSPMFHVCDLQASWHARFREMRAAAVLYEPVRQGLLYISVDVGRASSQLAA